MAMSRRSLQRKLAERGVSYRILLDRLRHDLAKRYLITPSTSLTDIAFLLGFSEHSAFARAFKRWQGSLRRAFAFSRLLSRGMNPTERRRTPSHSLKCWCRRDYRELDISECALIKAEQKYVIGVLPDGVEWFLPHKTSVEGVELAALQFMRVSRSALVAPAHVLGVSGHSKKRTLHTSVGDYRLSRLVRLETVMAAAQSNAGKIRPL
ncbi:helix-turn-helix transcriptional regulator [Pseudomonas sp. OV226]|uniref:helix-turn-helix transcriptional regulator n=1 Tax=Pseudomonas sp. OV226 TaxID=2135588 RepID=UPI002115AC1B|nr:helix-turn-helix transcriptional regulator [Pseudomonas sp. OV226]